MQNTQLDSFHLREQLDRMAHEIDQGKIIGSMHLDNNIHAQVGGAKWGHGSWCGVSECLAVRARGECGSMQLDNNIHAQVRGRPQRVRVLMGSCACG